MALVTLACQFCGKFNQIDVVTDGDRPKCAECSRPFLLDRPIKVLEEHFDKTVLGCEIPVIVDFYADWCGPCVAMGPLLDELAHECQGQILVFKVDIDASPTVSKRYDVKSIPFFARFESGEVTKTAVGAVDKAALWELADG